MTTDRRDDAGAPFGTGEEEFVRWLADAYTPPPMTGARRARFDARLEARLDARAHRGPWLAAAATGAFALAIGAWSARVADRGAAGAASPARSAGSAEAVLALATDPVADAEEALPTEYRAISYLLIDAQGAPIR